MNVNQNPLKTIKIAGKFMKTNKKVRKNKTSKNIVNDGEVQIISSDGNVRDCVQKNQYRIALKKRPLPSHCHTNLSIA